MINLRNDAERRVVSLLRDLLPDSWQIIPSLEITTPGVSDHELDVILISPSYGIVDLEVKGHRPTLRDGIWCQGDRPMEPQPDSQARDNAYTLMRLLKEQCGLNHLFGDHAIGFPNATELIGALPKGLRRQQALTLTELENIRDSIIDLMLSDSRNRPLDEETVAEIVGVLCPDAVLVMNQQVRSTATRDRLDAICDSQVRALAGLDVNRRVAVSGSAGTGKTRLAETWARRAWARDERVLLTCYNEPLAEEMRSRLPHDPDLKVGAFLSMALQMEGMEPIEVPDEDVSTFWDITAVGHLFNHWHDVSERFDTIVIDEAQDFSPTWIAALEALLDPDGARRMLLVGDDRQLIYRRGFITPLPEDGWVRAELPTNCRNSAEIAQLLRRFLDGAPAPAGRPEGTGVRWEEATDGEQAVTATRTTIQRLRAEGFDSSNILVEALDRPSRDLLISSLGLRRWDQREPGDIACEAVHRIKGLESDAVILVTPEPTEDDALLYVGISRAVSSLTIIGPRALARRLRLVEP